MRSPGGGDNLYTASIVALDADTGQYVWHYQINPRDAWDYDCTQQMTLAELVIDGKPRDVLMQAPKNGFFYVIDRITGKLDLGREDRQGDLGGSHRSRHRSSRRGEGRAL